MGKLHKISNKIIAGKSIQAGFYIGIKSFYEYNNYLRAKTDKLEIKNKYELEDYQLMVIPSNTITPGLYILVTEILHGQRSSEILFGETHYKSGYLVKKAGAHGSDIIDEHFFEFKPKTLCNNEKSNLKYAIYWSFFKPAIEYDLNNVYYTIKQTIDKNEYYNNLLTIAKSYFLIDSIYNSETSLELFSDSLATVGYVSNVFGVNDYMPIVISSFSAALKAIWKAFPVKDNPSFLLKLVQTKVVNNNSK